MSEYYDLLQSVQRRDSLGLTTKIPRLSKGSMRQFRTRRGQSSFSSVSDVFANNESIKGQADLSVSGRKLRSEKNLDSNHGLSAETGTKSGTLVYPFDEGERTLIRPDFEPSEDLEREEVERKYCSGECPNQRLRVISGEKNFHTRPIHTHLWPSRARTR